MHHPSSRWGSKRPDQSFSKEDRLLRRAEYLAATRKGRRYSTRYFLVFLRSNRKDRSRLGIVVSKKVGQAVKRNHLKRRLREFFRLHKPLFPSSADIVIVAKKGIPSITYKAVCEDLDRFFRSVSFPGKRGRRSGGNKVDRGSHRSA